MQTLHLKFPLTRHQLLATRHGASIACYSINRAKGLERRAIILTGLPATSATTQSPRATAAKPRSSFCLHTSSFSSSARTFVLGATRAQQLLALLQ